MQSFGRIDAVFFFNFIFLDLELFFRMFQGTLWGSGPVEPSPELGF